MLLQHFFSLAFAATLSTCLTLKRSDEGLSPVSELEARTSYSTERGVIIGEPTDTLRTYGLSTCVGMVAVGAAGPTNVNKVLSHIACDDAINLMNEWADTVRTFQLTDLYLAVSVLDPDLLPEDLRDAQKVLNRSALQTALLLVLGEGWRLKPYVRPNLEGPDPEGTMFVTENNEVQADGNPVGWPSPPTLDVDCFWPVLYQPSTASDEDRAAAGRIADGICGEANGCSSGTPHCVTANTYPLGKCVCV